MNAKHLAGSFWAPAALGAAVGACSLSLNPKRRTGYHLAMGSLVGSALGLGCAAAWASRRFTGELARGVLRDINTARDARWLERNPITYA